MSRGLGSCSTTVGVGGLQCQCLGEDLAHLISGWRDQDEPARSQMPAAESGSILVIIRSLRSIGSRRCQGSQYGWRDVLGRGVGRRGMWEAGLYFRLQSDQGLGARSERPERAEAGNFVTVKDTRVAPERKRKELMLERCPLPSLLLPRLLTRGSYLRKNVCHNSFIKYSET